MCLTTEKEDLVLLKDYLKKEGLAPSHFAKSVGMGTATIYRVLGGKARFSARLAVIVEQNTGGLVTRTEALWPEAFVQKTKNKRKKNVTGREAGKEEARQEEGRELQR